MFYELLTGRPPFLGPLDEVLASVLLDEPPPPSSLRPEVGPALDAVCLKALAKKPEDRYASMAEFAAALDRCRNAADPVVTLPVTVPTLSFSTPPPLPVRRSRRWLWASVAGVALALALVAGGLIYLRTGTGTVQINVDVPGAVVVVDDDPGQQPEDGRFRLSVGDHWVVVKYEGVAVAKRRIHVSRGSNEPVMLEITDELIAQGIRHVAPIFKGVTNMGTDMFGAFNKLVTDSKADMDQRDAEWEKRRQKELEEFEKRTREFFDKRP